MDQRTFVFATRGHCIKGKQCQHVTLGNKTIGLCYKQSRLFYFMHCPLVANQKACWSIGKNKSYGGVFIYFLLQTLSAPYRSLLN